MFTQEQNTKLNDIRASLTQGIDTLKSGETMIADVQTQLQALQAEIGVQAPVDTTPSQNGTYTEEQVAAIRAEERAAGKAEAQAADVTPYSAEDLAKVEASKNETIAALEKQIEELKAAQESGPVAADQEAAQEELADKLAALVQSIRDLTPSKIVAPAEPVEASEPTEPKA